MPTNLKSLLSRSRSRNELKSREKEDNESGSNHDENSDDGKVETDVVGTTNIPPAAGVVSMSPPGDDDGTLTNPCTSTNETYYSRSNFNESCNRVPQSNTTTSTNTSSPLEGLFTSGGYTSDGRKMFKSCSTLNQQPSYSSTQTTMTPTLPGLFTNLSKATSHGAAAAAAASTSSSQSTNTYRDEGKFRCQIEFVGGETDCCGVSNSCSSSGGAAGPGTTYATQSSSHNYHNHHHNLYTPSPTVPSSSHFQSSSASSNLPMRKCETVLALSSFSRDNSTSSPSDSVGSTTISSTGSTGKVKLVKDKILSTSSSTLNCLLHSTSRAKLFSSWKLSSSNTNNSSSQHFPTYPDFLSPTSSSSGGGPTTGCHASSVNSCNCRAAADPSFHMHNHHHHSQHQQISKSQQQLLLPGSNNFPSGGLGGGAPLTPTNRLRRNISITNACFSLSPNSSYSRSSSVASFCWREKVEDSVVQPEILCRLCLCNVRMDETVEILGCSCRYCKDCIVAYISFEIQEGAEDIACPDATCEGQGVLTLPEIESLLPLSLVEKHKKFRMYREVEKDGHLMWCPTPGCETVCRIQEATSEHLSSSPLSSSSSGDVMLQGSKLSRSSGNRSLIINCATCQISFCAECKLSWHPGTSCESFRRKLIKQGKLSLEDEELYSLDSIKKCPFCHVPIEKDSGCAQMMCKRCKHVFCWYCLASLDDDFLLRHYDKGPCKNKLGHSRASVVWHRAQVIGIFAGFGVLVLLASPLLILAAPCLLCCRCRYCANKDSEDSPVAV